MGRRSWSASMGVGVFGSHGTTPRRWAMSLGAAATSSSAGLSPRAGERSIKCDYLHLSVHLAMDNSTYVSLNVFAILPMTQSQQLTCKTTILPRKGFYRLPFLRISFISTSTITQYINDTMLSCHDWSILHDCLVLQFNSFNLCYKNQFYNNFNASVTNTSFNPSPYYFELGDARHSRSILSTLSQSRVRILEFARWHRCCCQPDSSSTHPTLPIRLRSS